MIPSSFVTFPTLELIRTTEDTEVPVPSARRIYEQACKVARVGDELNLASQTIPYPNQKQQKTNYQNISKQDRMSDPTAEPGVPAENHPDPDTSVNIPPAAEKKIAEVKKRAPGLVDLVKTPDRILLRLNKFVLQPNTSP